MGGNSRSHLPVSATLTSLEVWQQARSLAAMVYQVTADWPTDERYGLTAQSRRAAVSIAANLAEGVGRGSSGEIARFSGISLGSLYELETLLVLADDLRLTAPERMQSLHEHLSRLAKQLERFRAYHETKRHPPQAPSATPAPDVLSTAHRPPPTAHPTP